MKKIAILLILLLSTVSYCSTSTTGATGTIDFPNAYNLLENNYAVTAILDRMEGDGMIGVMLQGGFIKQLEAGFKISNKEKSINKDLLKSNIKFQFLKEADNPAIAIGFVESDEALGNDNEKEGTAYGYIVASKRFKNFFRPLNSGEDDGGIKISGGLKYDDKDDWNGFSGLEFMVFQRVKLLSEVYSYCDYDNSGTSYESKDRKISLNLGGEFYTADKLTTKVFWRERNDSFGISLTYLGLYK